MLKRPLYFMLKSKIEIKNHFPVTNRVFAQDVCHSLTPSVGRSLGPSVRRSVGRSVGPSVRHSFKCAHFIVIDKILCPLPISPHFFTRYACSYVRRVETPGRPFIFFFGAAGEIGRGLYIF